MIPDCKNLIFSMAKIALEKMIAGNMYLKSIIKTMDFLMNRKKVSPAKTNKINRYKKF
jgi:hypothetical protein